MRTRPASVPVVGVASGEKATASVELTQRPEDAPVEEPNERDVVVAAAPVPTS
jgi:hypothetical protein